MGRTIIALSGVGKSFIRSNIRYNTTTANNQENAVGTLSNFSKENPIWLQEDKLPSNFWENKDNQIKFAEWAAKQLHIREMDDWYKVTRNELYKIGGTNLLSTRYGGSPMNFLMAVFPKYPWLPWKFTKSPRGYWDIEENQVKFLKWAGMTLSIKEMSDWYNVTKNDFERIGGNSLLKRFGTLHNILSKVYPEYDWLPWKFSRTPKGYWEDPENQKIFIEWATKKLNIKEMSDWYKITMKDFDDIGAASILNVNHNDSVYSLLCTIYPEYDWLPWKFVKTPKNYWDNDKHKLKFFEWAGKQLGVKEISDWNNISAKDVMDLGGYALLAKTTLPQVLSIVYPEHTWQTGEIQPKTPHHKKSQYLLKSMLEVYIFPQEELLEDYRHPSLYSSESTFLEIDFYYPKFKLALEYQGEQHYNKTQQFFSNITSNEERNKRDVSKSNMCKEAGITLVEIPYWWDRTADSLAATIYVQRPDLFQSKPKGDPVPQNPPIVSNKVEPSQSRKLFMTAMDWDSTNMDPTGWVMTEKFDGMRLYWTGTEFLSRAGRKATLPPQLVSGMPDIALDGELWTKYGLYQDAVSLFRSKLDDERWQNAVYYVFDAPTMDKSYEERIQRLREMKESGQLPPFAKVIETVKCTGKQHLQEYFSSIIAKGGEGVMLREANSTYTAGRSPSLRKYKDFKDTEVKVIRNNYPHGFDCLQINGKSLYVGLSSNYEVAKNIKPNSIITVKHQGTNAYGTLLYPKFFRERTDVTWEELINT